MNKDEFVWARSDDSKCSQWESLGYELVGESWGAHLDIADSFDLSLYEAKIERARGSGVEIRALTKLDIPEVIQLETANERDYPFTPATEHSVPNKVELEDLIDESGFIFGAINQENLIGVLATKNYTDKVEFEFASISSAYRGKGIAGGLGSFAILRYLENGVNRFATGGAAINASSKGSVESLSFTIDEIWRSYRKPS